MAAACYEKEVTIESANHGLGHPHPQLHHHHVHHHHHHHHRTNGNVSATVSGSSTGTTSSNRSATSATAAVTVIGQTILSPSSTTTDIVIPGGSPYKTESTTGTNFKDYAQPLHVDCSVEYELPSQAKPPPGGGEPLLMIHPCYYRRAERERRSPFVNNLPPIVSSSSSSRKSSRRGVDATAVNSNLTAAKSMIFQTSNPLNATTTAITSAALAGGDAAAAAAAAVATATAAVAATTTHTSNLNGSILLGDALNASTPSSATISTILHSHRKVPHRREDDQTNALDPEIEKKRLSQQHRSVFPTTANANLTTADEKAVISGIYQHYFRAMRSHHHHHHHHHLEVDQLQSQNHHLYEDSHLRLASKRSSVATSPVTGAFVQNFQIPIEPTSTGSCRRRTTTSQQHPYRRPPAAITRASTAVPHVPSSPSEGAAAATSSVYATAMNRQRAASLQALRVAAAAVAAAAAATAGGGRSGNNAGSSFYEGPAYRALLPRS